jgi:hypothetical protein
VLEQIGFFYGLGAMILIIAAHASGRLSVRSVRDVRAADRRYAAAAEPVTTTSDAAAYPATDATATTATTTTDGATTTA